MRRTRERSPSRIIMSSDPQQPIQGMSDMSAPEVERWQSLEYSARDVMRRYGLREIRTPMMEYESVFLHSLGATSDVVQKEMYVMEDRAGRRLALRPEGTAGVMRYLAGCGPEADQARLYYMGPMFRCERPQAGRKRQFHQVGVEIMGPPRAAADAECMLLQMQLLREWGIEDGRLLVNTRGQADKREDLNEALRSALAPHRDILCGDCARRFDVNVMRVLDCKQDACRNVVEALPDLASLMDDDARRYFESVCEMLDAAGAAYDVAPKMVRGLDYYEHTVWEITHPALGAQDALAGGGRYVVEMGGRTLHGVGFAVGMERVMMVLSALDIGANQESPREDIRLVSLGDEALRENFALCERLRRNGRGVGMDLNGRSMKAQMREANKSGARWVVICGESELQQGKRQLKNMRDGTQRTVAASELEDILMDQGDL